jgi:hypothetical protein
MAAREALDIKGRRYPATYIIISSLANFSCCHAESATLAIFLLHLELLLPPFFWSWEEEHIQPIRNKKKVKDRF